MSEAQTPAQMTVQGGRLLLSRPGFAVSLSVEEAIDAAQDAALYRKTNARAGQILENLDLPIRRREQPIARVDVALNKLISLATRDREKAPESLSKRFGPVGVLGVAALALALLAAAYALGAAS